MFEDIGDIIKRRFISAFHTVLRGFVEFLPFTITMFAVLFALLSASFFATQGYATEKADMEAAYNYHVSVKGLNQSQMLIIRDDVRTVFWNDFCYQTVSVDTHTFGKKNSYDVYLRLLTGNKNYGFKGIFIADTLASNYQTFLLRYHDVLYADGELLAGVSVETSPLYDLEAHAWQAKITQFFMLFAVSVISMFLLMGIYNVRVNNQKFLYGIYSTFGADRKRLCATSSYEILICSAFAFVPALLCSILFCRSAFAETSTGFNFSLSAIFWTLPFLLVIVLLGTYFPIKALSRKEPMAMIIAEDNSNLVSSPSRSANILKRRSPLRYESLTLLRFRNRILKLLAMSAIFCAMFVSGIYLADVYTVNTEIKAKTSAAFTLTFADTVPDAAIERIEAIDGVREAHKNYHSVSAEQLASHILIHKEDVSSLGGLRSYKKDTNLLVETDFSYIPAADEDILEFFDSFYGIEGDPLSVLQDNTTVAIGISKNNQDIYNFEVGDTIRIGILQYPLQETLSDQLSGAELLEAQLETFRYKYVTLTVGAVIHAYPSALYGTPIILPQAVFDELVAAETEPAAPVTTDATTEAETPAETEAPLIYAEPITLPKTNQLHVYLQDELVGKDIDRIEFTLRDIANAYKNVTVTASGSYHDNWIAENKQYHALIATCSIGLLLFVPIIWFFSQILFYKRRSTEFDILLSIAATEKHIRKLHTSDSFLLGLAAILSLPFSVLCTYLINKFFTRILPTYIKLGTEIVLEPRTRIWTYLLCMALTLLCSVLSALIPFWMYKKRKRAVKRNFPPRADA